MIRGSRGNRVLAIIEELEKDSPDNHMKSSRVIQRILEAIRESETICVVGHVRPDGDCIGSQLGLAMALQNQGKKVTCLEPGHLPRKLAFMDTEKLLDQPKPGKKFDLVIATDCASFERLGTVGPCIQQRKLFINIDHHESNTRYGDINWVNPRQPSTGELIFRLLRSGNWAITPAIANCLFTAISTDTGSFQYPSTRPSTYQVAGKLVDRGADLAKVCNEVYQSYPLSRVRLLKHLFNKFNALEAILAAEFRILRAEGGAAALALLASEDVAVMITDYRMPGMTGVELCRRGQEVAPEVLRIILTAYTDVDSLMEAINTGHIWHFVAQAVGSGLLFGRAAGRRALAARAGERPAARRAGAGLQCPSPRGGFEGVEHARLVIDDEDRRDRLPCARSEIHAYGAVDAGSRIPRIS